MYEELSPETQWSCGIVVLWVTLRYSLVGSCYLLPVTVRPVIHVK